MRPNPSHRIWIVARASLRCAAALCVTWTAHAGELVDFSIPPQPLETALLAFSDQAGAQVATSSAGIAALATKGVSGRMTPRSALERLIEGSDVEIRSTGDRSFSLLASSDPSMLKMRAQGSQDSTPASPTAPDGAEPESKESIHPSATSSGTPKSKEKDEGPNDGEPTARGNVTATLETVVVTAQKRIERLQDVPISIAVIGNQDIERRGLIGMEDYLRSIPGVNQIDMGPQSNSIVVRGITTQVQFENFNGGTTVGTYFDETPITGAAGVGGGGIDIRPVDLERIEVLRGPQGTTYGSASLSGTLRLIPRQPKLDRFVGRLSATYSNTGGFGGDNSILEGIANVPLVENTFGLRAVAYRYDQSGFYENAAGSDPTLLAFTSRFGIANVIQGYGQDDVGRMLSTGGRLAALWQTTEKLSLSLNFLTQQIEQDGMASAGSGEFEQARMPIAPQARSRGEQGEVNDSDIDLLAMRMTYDLDWAELTVVTSHVESGSNWSLNSGTLPFPDTSRSQSAFEAFSSEMRLASTADGPLRYLGGVFYEENDDEYFQRNDWPGQLTTNPFGGDPNLRASISRRSEQRAAFGELSYAITNRLAATAGGRYYKYDKSDRSLLDGPLAGVPIGAGTPRSLATSEDGSIFKGSVSYRPSDEAMVYASWAEGFRLGRPDTGVPAAACDRDADGIVDGTTVSLESTRRVNSDSLENYEVGAKLALFDRRMTVDATVYHIEWNGLPVRTVVGPCGFAYFPNLGAARSDGVELQVSFLLATGLRIDVGGSYNDAELTEDAPGLGVTAGARLPGSPKVNANLSAQYDFDVVGRRAFVRADSLYAGEFYGDLQETPALAAGGYATIDVSGGVALGAFGVGIFVRNLTDKSAFTYRGNARRPRDPDFGSRLRPRTVGLQLTYDF